MNKKLSNTSVWIDFLICFFLGAYGIHKFREKKIGIGILYLFTGGLFIFGWAYDWIKMLVIAISITRDKNTNWETDSERTNLLFSRAKKIALLVVVCYALFFVLIVACSSAIGNDNDLGNIIETSGSSTSINNSETTNSTTESTTTSTTEPTTAPTTEPPHTHSFSAATCTTPKTCSCGATEGNANGHNWKNATCQTPKTCTTCGTTEGTTADHNWKGATYTNPKTCTICGITEGNPKNVPNKENYHGHVYTGGDSSTKYHYEADCPGKYSHEITWDEVERRNLGPCKTCVLN